MRSWSVGYSLSSTSTTLVVEVGPWYAFFARAVAETAAKMVPVVSLPDISVKIEGKETSLRDKYGDLRRYFRAQVTTPVSDWAGKLITVRHNIQVPNVEAQRVLDAAGIDR